MPIGNIVSLNLPGCAAGPLQTTQAQMHLPTGNHLPRCFATLLRAVPYPVDHYCGTESCHYLLRRESHDQPGPVVAGPRYIRVQHTTREQKPNGTPWATNSARTIMSAREHQKKEFGPGEDNLNVTFNSGKQRGCPLV